MRVLIADGERDAVMTLGILLRSEGHEVYLSEGGLQVAAAVRQFKPRIVLLDLEMRDRSGYDVARDLSREHGSACPVLVAVAEHSGTPERSRAALSGFDHLVAKPYDPDDLLALVRRIGAEEAEPS